MRNLIDRIHKGLGGKSNDVTADLLIESTVDFPQEGLDPQVWVEASEAEGGYLLREDVKQQILEYIQFVPDEKLISVVDTINIVGSICTNMYQSDADIDVHIIPIVDQLPENAEEWQQEIKKWSHENPVYVNEHPIELYVQLSPAQDMLSDGCYEMLMGEWKKGPKIVSLDYNPYEVFASVLDRVRELAKEADIELGELKRDVIDYEEVRAAMSRLPYDYKAKLEDDLLGKLAEIESDINDLLGDKKEWVELRRSISRPADATAALQDVESIKKWQDVNATFKFLNRYKYIKLITQLEKLLADDRLESGEVKTLGSLLGIGR